MVLNEPSCAYVLLKYMIYSEYNIAETISLKMYNNYKYCHLSRQVSKKVVIGIQCTQMS